MMTGPRKRTTAQEELLRRIRRAVVEERGVRALAEAEAKEMVERRVSEARTNTNALLYQAYYGAKITKSAITSEGMGTSNKQAADERIRDYIANEDVTKAETFAEQASEPVPTRGLRVEVEGSAVTVVLDNFTHPDLGTELTGQVRYDASGKHLGTFYANDAVREAADNPFWYGNLWDLDEVTEATR